MCSRGGTQTVRLAWQAALPGISIVWGPQELSLFLLTKKKGPSLMQLGCRATRTASSKVETVELWCILGDQEFPSLSLPKPFCKGENKRMFN